jgi:hypothetical protein
VIGVNADAVYAQACRISKASSGTEGKNSGNISMVKANWDNSVPDVAQSGLSAVAATNSFCFRKSILPVARLIAG